MVNIKEYKHGLIKITVLLESNISIDSKELINNKDIKKVNTLNIDFDSGIQNENKS
jgi:hypothetical protein